MQRLYLSDANSFIQDRMNYDVFWESGSSSTKSIRDIFTYQMWELDSTKSWAKRETVLEESQRD